MIPFGFDAMQPLYPLIVQQCMDDYGLEEGVAVEVGAGPGHLSVEFAKATSMELILVDIDGAAGGKRGFRYQPRLHRLLEASSQRAERVLAHSEAGWNGPCGGRRRTVSPADAPPPYLQRHGG